jgi:DamX protein
MAISELHSRLEHLVNYSSQLIFVSEDKFNQQSQIIDTFLGHQGEGAEVAIIKASAELSVNEYRSQIYKQFMGPQALGDFNRNLSHLLVGLNAYDGPVLISISDAENLPQLLLQELWELVLQRRFATRKQHLNVLLFADPQWAEHAKTWLPANTGNRPILLSSQSINSPAMADIQTDLEKLLHLKREQFAEHIKGREESYQAIRPVLAKPWLLSLVAIVFISVFGGILWWQYPEVPQSLLTQTGAKLSEPRGDVSAAPSPTEDLLPQDSSQDSGHPILSRTRDLARQTSEPLAEKGLTAANIEHKAVDPNALVTDWQSALSQIDEAGAQTKSAAEPGIKNTSTKLRIKEDPLGTSDADRLFSDTQDTRLGKVDDYKVDDITSVEQLKVQTGAVKPVNPPIEVEAISQDSAQIEDDAAPAYRYNEETLLLLAEDQYLLQIAATSNVVTMQEYIQDNRLQQQVWIYKTLRQGKDWFVLLHKKTYESLLAARQARTNLPSAMQQRQPFAKTSAQVQEDISQTAN